MYIICIEINKHRMIIYKNIRRDERKERRINTFGDVCWFFRSFYDIEALRSEYN